MNPKDADTALNERPSPLVQRLQSQLLPLRQSVNLENHLLNLENHSLNLENHSLNLENHSLNLENHSLNLENHSLNLENHASATAGAFVSGHEQRSCLSRNSTRSSVAKPPDVPNMGDLIHWKIEERMQITPLDTFVNLDCLIYPFEVNVNMDLPKPNDFLWDFKHKFYLSIMYSQVYRYFFPFNRHNSQLFCITNESQTDEALQCLNIPSRIMLHNYKNMRSLFTASPESITVAAVSAYKDYLAFFRLNSKQQPCPDAYKNFCYVPPVWNNTLD